jgi:hypothetical protein
MMKRLVAKWARNLADKQIIDLAAKYDEFKGRFD